MGHIFTPLSELAVNHVIHLLSIQGASYINGSDNNVINIPPANLYIE